MLQSNLSSEVINIQSTRNFAVCKRLCVDVKRVLDKKIYLCSLMEQEDQIISHSFFTKKLTDQYDSTHIEHQFHRQIF